MERILNTESNVGDQAVCSFFFLEIQIFKRYRTTIELHVFDMPPKT